uniref:14 kDa phosphohistidine phosphatase n=1 Tax=Podarcis muralis TaxID=64176 RepID=A0A670K2D5_PODMU|nr:14 kDa phosphohistidine phosphatase-like [Podarcis muralis]
MAVGDLKLVSDVDIDEADGVFKYVLIRVTTPGSGPGKDVVRGYAWAEYHGEGTPAATSDWARRSHVESGGGFRLGEAGRKRGCGFPLGEAQAKVGMELRSRRLIG